MPGIISLEPDSKTEKMKKVAIVENAEEDTCQFCGRNIGETMTEDGVEKGCNCR